MKIPWRLTIALFGLLAHPVIAEDLTAESLATLCAGEMEKSAKFCGGFISGFHEGYRVGEWGAADAFAEHFPENEKLVRAADDVRSKGLYLCNHKTFSPREYVEIYLRYYNQHVEELRGKRWRVAVLGALAEASPLDDCEADESWKQN